MSPITQDDTYQLLIDDSEIKSNLGQTIIITTEDKIKLCLIDHLKKVKEKNGWITPAGLFLSIFITLLTTDFNDWIINKEVWQAIFIIALFIFLIWLVVAIIKCFKIKSIDDIVDDIKKSQIKNPIKKDERANLTIEDISKLF